MIKHFIDYCISSIVELKTKIICEIGFVSAAGIGAFFDGILIPNWLSIHLNISLLPAWMQFACSSEFWDWLIKNSAEGLIHGIMGTVGALILAASLRGMKKCYLKIKAKLKFKQDGNGSATS